MGARRRENQSITVHGETCSTASPVPFLSHPRARSPPLPSQRVPAALEDAQVVLDVQPQAALGQRS